jgi:hypothetical protein
VADIKRFCDRRITWLLADFPDCSTPSEVLDCVANKLGLGFEVIQSDEQLRALVQAYAGKGEKAFANLEAEFRRDAYGVLIRRQHRESWEHSYVSVIDGRGDKFARVYFTKWHEVAHLLTLTDQMRLTFWRSHCTEDLQNPEESMMDVIAGHFGFRPPEGFEFDTNVISFEAIEELRRELCPEASKQSALISFVKFWPSPALLIHAELALKSGERAIVEQGTFAFAEKPQPLLRAVKVTPSDAAREGGFNIFRNMRVPEQSVIRRVFDGEAAYAEAEEDMSWWESSDGTILPEWRVTVKARRSREAVEALIAPLQ